MIVVVRGQTFPRDLGEQGVRKELASTINEVCKKCSQRVFFSRHMDGLKWNTSLLQWMNEWLSCNTSSMLMYSLKNKIYIQWPADVLVLVAHYYNEYHCQVQYKHCLSQLPRWGAAHLISVPFSLSIGECNGRSLPLLLVVCVLMCEEIFGATQILYNYPQKLFSANSITTIG